MCRFALTLQQTPPRALRSSFMIREEEDKKEEVVAFFILFIYFLHVYLAFAGRHFKNRKPGTASHNGVKDPR